MVVLRHIVQFVDAYSNTLNNLHRGLTNIQNAANAVNPAANATAAALVGLASAAAASTIGFGLAVKNAADLEDSIARLATVTYSESQSIQTSLKNAEAAARDFSTRFTASTKEVIDAQFELAEAGVPVVEQITAVQAAYKLARGAQGDFSETTKLLGTFLNTFGQNAEFGMLDPLTKIQRLTDSLAVTVQKFQVTLPVLAEGFKFVVGPANQLGLKFEEVATALGILNTAGFRGSLAGTALSNTFNKVQRAIDKLDLDPTKFTDVEGNIKSLASFIDEVGKSLENKSPLQGQIALIDTFDIRAGRIIKTLINTNEQLKRMTAELNVSEGATDEMASTLERTTNSQFKKFGNIIENISTSIGKTFNESLRSAVAGLNDIGASFQKWIEDNKQLVTILSLVVVGLTSLAAIMATIGIATAAFGTGLATVVTTLLGAGAAAAVVLGAFQAMAVTLAGLGIVGGIIALVAVIKGLANDTEDAIAKQDLFNKKVLESDNINKGAIDVLQTMTAEYKKLGNAANFSKIGIGSTTREIGISNLAKIVQELRRASGGREPDDVLIKRAFDFGAFELDIKEFADRFGLTKQAVMETVEAVTQLNLQLDPMFSKMNKLEQATVAWNALAVGAKLALTNLADGDDNLARGLSVALTALEQIGAASDLVAKTTEEVRKLQETATPRGTGPIDFIKSFFPDDLDEAINNASAALDIFEAKQIKLIEAFTTNIDAVQRSALFTQDFKDQVLEAAQAIELLGKDVTAFANTQKGQTFFANAEEVTRNIKLQQSALILFGAQVGETTRQVERSFNIQITNIEAVTKALKAYEGGGLTLEQFQGKTTKAFENLRTVLFDLPGLIEKTEAQLADLNKKGLSGTPLAKGVEKQLQELIDNIPELTAEIKLKEFEVDEREMFARLTGIVGDLSKHMETEVRGFAGDFAGSILEGIKTGDVPNIGADIGRQFRLKFVSGFSETLSLQIAGPIKDALTKTQVEFSKVLALNPKLQFNIPQAMSEFQKVFERLNPELIKQFGNIPLFSDLDDKKKGFEDIANTIAKIQTLQLTTDRGTQGVLEELKGFLGTKPIDFLNLQEVEGKIAQISQLLTGFISKDAQGAITNVLEELFKRAEVLKGSKQGSGQDLTAASTTVANNITTAATSLQSGLEAGAQAIANLVTPAVKALDDLLKTLFTNGASTTGGGPDQVINNSFRLGDRTFNIPVSVTGGTGTTDSALIDERSVKEIVDETEKRMTASMKEDLRALEDRLRRIR